MQIEIILETRHSTELDQWTRTVLRGERLSEVVCAVLDDVELEVGDTIHIRAAKPERPVRRKRPARTSSRRRSVSATRPNRKSASKPRGGRRTAALRKRGSA